MVANVLRVDTDTVGSASSLTLNASAPAGTNFVVLVGTYAQASGSTTATTFSATVDGVAAHEELASGGDFSDRDTPNVVLFTKRTSDTTAIDYTVSASASQTRISIAVIYCEDIDGTTDTDGINDSAGTGFFFSGTSQSVDVDTPSGDSLVIGAFAAQGGDITFTPGSGFTEEADFDTGGVGNFDHSTGIQSQQFSSSGTQACGMTLSSSDGGSGAGIALTSAAGGQNVAVGLTTETDTALAITVRQLIPVGQATETNSAQSISPAVLVAVGLASETNTAQAIDLLRNVAVGLASETDTAQSIAIEQTVDVGLASETNTAQTISPDRVVSVGQAEETNTALAVSKQIGIGLASETDTAFDISPDTSTIVAVGLTTETDTSQSITAQVGQSVDLDLTTETDAAFDITIRQLIPVGQASETNSALPIQVVEQGAQVSILDDWTEQTTSRNSIGSFAVSSGDDRFLIAVVMSRSGTAAPLTGLSWGDQAMTEQLSLATTDGPDLDTQIFTLDEAGIAAGVDTTFDPDPSTASNVQFRMHVAAYEGVDQSASIVDSFTATGASGANPTTEALTTGAAGVAIAVLAANRGTDDVGATEDASYSNMTEEVESAGTQSYLSTATADTDGSDFTPGTTLTHETDGHLLAFALRAVATVVSVGLASETNIAQDITPTRTIAIGLASETNTAQDANAVFSADIGQATETDTALSISPDESTPVNQATETNTAFAIDLIRRVQVGLAEETNEALALGSTGTVLVGTAEETNTALDITPPQFVQLDIATESNAAFFIQDANAGQITLLDAWTLIADSAATALTGVTFNVSSGSDRMLVVAIGEESSTGKPTGVTYGDQALTATGRATGDGTFPPTAEFYLLNEAGIAAAANSNIEVQGVDDHDGQFRMFVSTYQSVGQTGIIDADQSVNNGVIVPPITLTTAGLGSSLAMFVNSVGGVDVLWTNASEQIEEDASSSYHSISEQLTTGDDVTFEPTSDLVNRNVMAAISLPGVGRTISVDQATETNEALDVEFQRVVQVGQAGESNQALEVEPSTDTTVAVGLAEETNTAQDVIVTQPGVVVTSITEETDTAQEIRPAVGVDVGLASETNTALDVELRQNVFVGQAQETDTAQPISFLGEAQLRALERRNTAGTTGRNLNEAENEAKRLRAIRLRREREEKELLALMPAIAKSLLNLKG